MAIVLNLFSHSEWESLKSDPEGVNRPSGFDYGMRESRRDSKVCRWCVGCPLDGLCDCDQCGARHQSLYDYSERLAKHSSNYVWRGRYPNLKVYIEFLKNCGWV